MTLGLALASFTTGKRTDQERGKGKILIALHLFIIDSLI
jgi:hypothetical protein